MLMIKMIRTVMMYVMMVQAMVMPITVLIHLMLISGIMMVILKVMPVTQMMITMAH
jgi:hypothetical protein